MSDVTPEEAGWGTSAATRRDVQRADEVLARAEELRGQTARFLDELDRAIQELREQGRTDG